MTASLPSASCLTYYPSFLFQHSPTYSQWVRLSAKDFHEGLHRRSEFEGPDLWFYLNHPVKYVRVVGIVVAYDDLEKRIDITRIVFPPLFSPHNFLSLTKRLVDDGSGRLINLIVWKDPLKGEKRKLPLEDLKGIHLYSVIKAKGNVGEFRGTKQLVLRRVSVLRDTNDEVDAWGEAADFKETVLSKPWTLSQDFICEEKRKLERATEVEERREARKHRKEIRRLEKEVKEREAKEVGGVVGREGIDRQSRKGEIGENGALLLEGLEQVAAYDVQVESGFRGRRRPPLREKSAPLLLEHDPKEPPLSQSQDPSRISALDGTFRPPYALLGWPKPEHAPAPGSSPTRPSAAALYPLLRQSKPHVSRLDGRGLEVGCKKNRHQSREPLPILDTSSQRTEVPTLPESGFRGHRRSSRPPSDPVPLSVVIQEDHPTSPKLQLELQSQPLGRARSFLGRRRRMGSEPAPAKTVFRIGQAAPPKLDPIPPSPPHVVRRARSSRHSPSSPRAPDALSCGDIEGKPGSPFDRTQLYTSTSSYRGRRRRAESETASALSETAIKRPKLAPLPGLPNPLELTSSYHWRCQAEGSQPLGQTTRLSSHESPGLSDLDSEGLCRDSPPQSPTPPSLSILPAEGSTYRGRRRVRAARGARFGV